MNASRAKQLVGLVLAAAATAVLAGVLVIAGLSIVHTGSGADPADALSAPQVVPEDLGDLVVWQTPSPGLDRQVEPSTRLLIEAAWVQAWQEVDSIQRGGSNEVEARFMPGIDERVGEGGTGTQRSAVIQHGHGLTTTFYSLDGSVMTLDISSELERTFSNGLTLRSVDHYEVVLLLSDGKWRILRLTRVASSPVDALAGR